MKIQCSSGVDGLPVAVPPAPPPPPEEKTGVGVRLRVGYGVDHLTHVLHSGTHCEKRHGDADDDKYLNENSNPSKLWITGLDDLRVVQK